MPMWRCPHCGTPQAETARCWVCHRSTTACATCRHFRRSVAAGLGFCTLDRERRPVRASDVRWCWEAPERFVSVDGATRRGASAGRAEAGFSDGRPSRQFVEVPTPASTDLPAAGAPPTAPAPLTNPGAVPATNLGADGGWNLWGDASD